MDLRFVIHRGLTLAAATVMSLCPVVILLIMLWPQLSSELQARELIILIAAIVMATLLVPPTRDLAGKLLDRYAYRTHANFQRTVRDVSRRFTRYLDLRTILSLVIETIGPSTECEGVAVYLEKGGVLSRFKAELRHRSAKFAAPEIVPEQIAAALMLGRELIAIDGLTEDPANSKSLRDELRRLNWALVLPLLSEDTVIGFIALGPKLSGDPFYPQDLDLLMTLANQAGIAIKNAQLYTQVVLANEYIENIVRTIESGVVAVDEAGRIAMFNRAAEQLTGLPAGLLQDQSADVLPASLGALLKSTVADGRERTEPEIQLPDGSDDAAGHLHDLALAWSRRGRFWARWRCSATSRRSSSSRTSGDGPSGSRTSRSWPPAWPMRSRIRWWRSRRSPSSSPGATRTSVRERVQPHRDPRGQSDGASGRAPARALAAQRPAQGAAGHSRAAAQAVEFLRPAFDEKRIALPAAFGREPRIVIGDARARAAVHQSADERPRGDAARVAACRSRLGRRQQGHAWCTSPIRGPASLPSCSSTCSTRSSPQSPAAPGSASRSRPASPPRIVLSCELPILLGEGRSSRWSSPLAHPGSGSGGARCREPGD